MFKWHYWDQLGELWYEVLKKPVTYIVHFYTTETSRDFKDATRKMNEKFKFFTKFAQKQKQETLNCYLLVLFITQIKSYLKMGKDNELTIYRQSPIFFITN